MPSIHSLLAWAPACIYLAGAVITGLAPVRPWIVAKAASRVALAFALSSLVAWLHAAWSGAPAPAIEAPGGAAAAAVTLLIAFLGWIIGDYSSRYLDGETRQRRFAAAFLATLGSVSVVVTATHLGIIIAAWAASSVALHSLLTFYRERPAAMIVAHKKFLASRLAELLLLAAAILLFIQWHTLDVAGIAAQVRGAGELPAPAAAAAVLIALAVLLKSAQLPLHGWLIQVMEAPTPVSALLHAGVVNLGGFVLIRLAPLIDASLAARTLLVIVGGATAAVAGLVMLTRVTIKVRLAWSTCSQMGFMIMECGLGLYDLALLHLLAHSLYKAHAFLTAGEAVRDALARQMMGWTHARAQVPVWSPVLALLLSAAINAGLAAGWQWAADLPSPPWIATALASVGLATLLWPTGGTSKPNTRGAVMLLAGAHAYLGWHWFAQATGHLSSANAPPLLAACSLGLIAGLYLAQAWVLRPRPGAFAARIYEWIYAGLYLDERFTRLTFRLWPVRA